MTVKNACKILTVFHSQLKKIGVNMKNTKKNELRSRDFSLISYILDTDTLIKIINEHDNIKYYAFIVHDKDEKEPHTHIILYVKNAITQKNVRQWFTIIDENGKTVNCLSESVISKKGVFDYLTHKNNSEKFQYNENDIKTNFKEFFTEKIDEVFDNSVNIIDDIMNGVSTYTLVKRYGNAFVYHYSNYKAIVNTILMEKREVDCANWRNELDNLQVDCNGVLIGVEQLPLPLDLK